MRIPLFLYGARSSEITASEWAYTTVLRGTPGNREGGDAVWGGKLAAGSADIVAAGWEETGDVTITRLSDGVTFDVDTDAGGVEGMLVEDVLGLGRKQIIIASQTDGLFIYDVDPTTFSVLATYQIEDGTDGVQFLEVIAVDMNGNGRKDLVAIGNGSGAVGYYSQPVDPADPWVRTEIGTGDWGMSIHHMPRGGLNHFLYCERENTTDSEGFYWFEDNGDGTWAKHDIDTGTDRSARQSDFVYIGGTLTYVLVPYNAGDNLIRGYVADDGDPASWESWDIVPPIVTSAIIQSIKAVVLPGDTRHSVIVGHANIGTAGNSGMWVGRSSGGASDGVLSSIHEWQKISEDGLGANEEKWDQIAVLDKEDGSRVLLFIEQFDPAGGGLGKGFGVRMVTPPA